MTLKIRYFRDWIAWAILALDALASIWIWNSVQTSVEQEARTRFEFRTGDIKTAIGARLRDYEQVLRGGVALFESLRWNVGRDAWKTYVDNLKIEKSYPGIQGIGFSLFIPAGEKDEHVRKIRAEGFPDYTIRPEGERDQYTSIIWLEPFSGRNLRAFGYDMFSEPVRNAAMRLARDSGETAISGKVILVQETEKDVQNGFLMYIPVYRDSGSAADGERQKALLGWVYSPFRFRDFMHGVLGAETAADIDVEVYDGNSIEKKTFLFDTGGSPAWKGEQKDSPYFKSVKTIEFNGHVWTLRFHSLPAFEALMDNQKGGIVLALGALFTLLCFVVVHGSLSIRNQALAARRQSELILGAAGEGIYGVDMQGRVTFINPAAAAMIGYSPQDFIGQLQHAILHHSRADGTPYPVEECLIYKAFKENRVFHVSDEVFWRRDGTCFPVEYVSTPILEDGKVTGAVVAFKDISDRKRTEERLLHMEKLSALGKLTASIAHEFNNPIYGVRLLLEQVENEAPLGETHKNHLRVAVNECNRMAGLIKKLQGFYRPSNQARADLDVNRIIEDMIVLSRKKLKERGIVLEMGLSPFLPKINGVEDQLKQVILNLIQNAEESIPPGRTDGKISLNTKSEDGKVFVQVRDNGSGIPPEIIGKIFDPFFTTKSAVKGTGLGLSVLHGIIESHKGKIEIDSAQGEGSVFTIILPSVKGVGPS